MRRTPRFKEMLGGGKGETAEKREKREGERKSGDGQGEANSYEPERLLCFWVQIQHALVCLGLTCCYFLAWF